MKRWGPIHLANLHLFRTHSLPSFAIDRRYLTITAGPPHQTRTPLNHWSHFQRHALTQLSAIGARPRLRPSEIPIYPVSHVYCCSLDLRAATSLRIGGTAPSPMPAPTRDRRLAATLPGPRHGGSSCRRSQADTRSPLLSAAKSLLLGLYSRASSHRRCLTSRSGPRCQVIQSRAAV